MLDMAKHNFKLKNANVHEGYIEYMCETCNHIETIYSLKVPNIFRALNSLKGSRGRCPYQESNQRWFKKE